MSEYTTEIHRKVFFDQEGHFLTVRPSPDFPDHNVLLHTEPSEVDWFGDVRIDMPIGFARLLGQALIAAADDIEAKNKLEQGAAV